MSYRARHPDVHQEEDIIPRGKVAFAVAVVFVVSGALVVLTIVLVRSSYLALRPSKSFPERELGPRHPVARVRQDLFDERRQTPTSRERQRVELRSYGWVDRSRGIVRIPIERAMEIIAEEPKR